MFVSIRKYDGVPDVAQLLHRVETALVPAVKAMHGFHSYTTVDLGHGSALSISMFDSQADAEAANAAVRGLVQQHLAALVPNPPTIMVGQVAGVFES